MVMMYRTCRLPWRNSFPRSGSCCVSNNPRGFLYLSAGYCCHWQDWPTCKVSSPKKKKKKKTASRNVSTAVAASSAPPIKSSRNKAIIPSLSVNTGAVSCAPGKGDTTVRSATLWCSYAWQ